HNHPIPMKAKAPIETKQKYRECIQAAGVTGSTVLKVDNVTSTRLILDGKTPSEFDSTLLNNRIKSDLLAAEKKLKYPSGMGLPGMCSILNLYMEDRDKPQDERYVHKVIVPDDQCDATIIVTGFASLLGLVHKVPYFECNFTYKRVDGLHEWELVIFFKAIQRSTTRSTTEVYQRIFDELRELTLKLTGKPLGFKCLNPEGNLLAICADMEVTQLIGAAKSLLQDNIPEYSHIWATRAEELIPHIFMLCNVHAIRAVLDFEKLVSKKDYQRLLDFTSLKSWDDVSQFDDFVAGLEVKRITEDRCQVPRNTNGGEGQHQWSNVQTGTKLPPVIGIVKGRVVDSSVADMVRLSLTTGATTNRNNDLHNRTSRQIQRHTASVQKKRESQRQDNISQEIAAEKEMRKVSLARQKELEARRVTASKRPSHVLRADRSTSSSSGRVKTVSPPNKTGTSSLLVYFVLLNLFIQSVTANC
ncbi:hypothetical protein C8J56DRAFT_785048, partial [Mycena floridula]